MTPVEQLELKKRILELEIKAQKKYLRYTDWTKVIAALSEKDEKEYWNLMDKLYEIRGEEE
tara:strand:- start:2309 stop:2491 length:183 start_codon:yes stop_codon:yes gene_type:complete